MIMKIKFYPRGSVIQCSISDGSGTRHRISTKIKLPQGCKLVDNKVYGPTQESKIANEIIEKHRSVITLLYLETRDVEAIKKHYNTPEPKPIEGECFDFPTLVAEYIRLMQDNKIGYKKHSANTIRAYKNIAKIFLDFSNSNSGFDLNRFVVADKKIKQEWQSYFRRFDQFMIEKNYSQPYRSNIMNVLNIMASFWSDDLNIKIPKIEYEQPRLSPISVLPHNFIKTFFSDDRYNDLDQELKFVWEISAVIMITTLRIQDALSLKPQDFQFKDGNCFMNKYNMKTGAMSQMPLPKVLSDKLHNNITSLGMVFSIKPNKAILYSRIKELFSMYPEMHQEITIKKIGVYGEEIAETMPYFLAVHPHMLRRTAITTMLVNGVSERHIKFASGHTDRSTAFERYVGFVEKKYQSEIENYYDKFLN